MTTFESTTCKRCGGTGKHSFNAIHKDTCYGCKGAGRQLTKRGKAASDYLASLRRKPAGEIQVGDLVRFETMTHAFFSRIESVGEDALNPGRIAIKATRASTGEAVRAIVFPSTPMTLGFSQEEKAAQLAQAIAYQETLTKSGQPRKR